MGKTRKKQRGGGWDPAFKATVETKDKIMQAKSEAAAVASEVAAAATDIPALSMEEASAKVATANRLLKQPWAKTLPKMGCLPHAMGGIPEAPHDFPLDMPCPSTALPAWGEAQAFAGPDSPLPMIPAPPFVASSAAAADLREKVNDKLDMIEKNMKLEKEAVSKGIHIPPYIEAADHETKQFTEEAARLLKPEQILLPWDSSKVDARMKKLGIAGLGSSKTGTSVPFMGSADGPNFDADAAHKLAVSDGGSGGGEGGEGGGGQKLDVYKRGFIYRGGRRRRRRRKRKGGSKTKKNWRRKVKSKTKKRRRALKQQILRDRRRGDRHARMQAKARDQAGRHHAWLVSLGVRKNFTFKSPGKMKFTKGKIDSLTKLLNKMSINKTKRRKSIKNITKTIKNLSVR